ncbi:ABC transporter substrate-binding protein [Agrococcus beijingensis]|uniref:ABC transporter substrate-binding protein n=1 Tax=Agrococcus beijingensis TaxID=3068634 RepID=UPI0027418A6E|nr:ABC transporter substrate-binding protein [Agrococcus sp. REN33]
MPLAARRSSAPIAARAVTTTAIAAIAAMLLSACGGPEFTPRLQAGTSVEVAWSGELTDGNAASTTGATEGNRDVAAMTRGAFAVIDADSEHREDPSFGVASIVEGTGPTGSRATGSDFTVRYDLADHVRWSDGVPLDGADLMLAWAASSNALSTPDLDVAALRGADGRLDLAETEVWFDVADAGGMVHAEDRPVRDDWARSIEVPFAQPVPDWRTALEVAVPAHVVGRAAFGVDDPMEAKQRVLDAIDRADPTALAPLAEAWSTALRIDAASPDPAALLSSGPYRVESIRDGRLELVANADYVGAQGAGVERIALRDVADQAAALAGVVAGEIDVATVRPTDADADAIRDLDRGGSTLLDDGDGTRWELVVRADRAPLQSVEARRSLFHAIDRRGLAEAALGERGAETTSADSVLFRPGTRIYDYALEDAGFPQAFGGADDELANAERASMGIPAGTPLCVRYDRADAFASAALPALAAQAALAGWAVQDCGVDDLAAGLAQPDWNVVLQRVPAPADTAAVVERWRDGGVAARTGPEREVLLDEALSTGDPDALEETLLEIEASLVADALVLPIVEPSALTVSAPGVQGVAPRPGSASLTWNAWEWGVEAAPTP